VNIDDDDIIYAKKYSQNLLFIV